MLKVLEGVCKTPSLLSLLHTWPHLCTSWHGIAKPSDGQGRRLKALTVLAPCLTTGP